jgi:hypothetical protein
VLDHHVETLFGGAEFCDVFFHVYYYRVRTLNGLMVDLVNPELSTVDWVGVFSPANFRYCSSLSLCII